MTESLPLDPMPTGVTTGRHSLAEPQVAAAPSDLDCGICIISPGVVDLDAVEQALERTFPGAGREPQVLVVDGSPDVVRTLRDALPNARVINVGQPGLSASTFGLLLAREQGCSLVAVAEPEAPAGRHGWYQQFAGRGGKKPRY